MNTITHSQRYLPHELNTKYYAVKLYRTGVGVAFVCRRYHISKSSLMRWNKKFDGSRESLLNQSHRPLSPHPNAHTQEELKWIKDCLRRNPKISVCELYGKLRTAKGYKRHPRFPLPHLSASGLFQCCSFHQNNVQTKTLRYSNPAGYQMADGC